MKIFIAGCARSGTTLTQRLMKSFADTTVFAAEASIDQFAKLDQAPVKIVKRTWKCHVTLPELPDDIRLLYCVRHPFDVLTSSHALFPDRRPFYVSQARWTAEYRAFCELRRRQPDRPTFVLRYEDLVADPDGIQQEISAFFDLTPTTRFSETQIRWSSIEKWKTRPELREYIRSLPGNFLDSIQAFCREFGYDGSRPALTPGYVAAVLVARLGLSLC